MFSSFKNLFKSAPKAQNNEKPTDHPHEKYNEDNSENFSEQETAEKTGVYVEKEEEKMRFRLAMDIFKFEDTTKSNLEINLYDTVKMFEAYFGEKLKNWKYISYIKIFCFLLRFVVSLFQDIFLLL